MTGGTRIRLQRCGKTFADRRRPAGTAALEPLDLAIEPGETMVFLGPSGCGKTTLLRLIAGLENPDAGGRVFFDDDDVTDLPIERRKVGMVFQSYALFPNLNVAENVAYGLKVRGEPPAVRARRVDEMLEMMRIADLKHRTIDQISGGQRQRVALARALAVQPRVLLLDEPLTALDAKLRDSLRIEINALLRALGITSVYVTHDQAEAMTLGDRIVVMSKGRIEQVGRARDIYFKPANRFVAEFIGTMNRLPAQAAGGLLRVNGGAPLSWPGPDGPLEILFRPEDAMLCEPAEGQISGTVRAHFFLGDRTRLVIDGQGCDIVVETTARREFARGAVVGLRLDPSLILAM
jgi:putative spermidine/putrescine transport system ATP-binding protein